MINVKHIIIKLYLFLCDVAHISINQINIRLYRKCRHSLIVLPRYLPFQLSNNSMSRMQQVYLTGIFLIDHNQQFIFNK